MRATDGCAGSSRIGLALEKCRARDYQKSGEDFGGYRTVNLYRNTIVDGDFGTRRYGLTLTEVAERVADKGRLARLAK